MNLSLFHNLRLNEARERRETNYLHYEHSRENIALCSWGSYIATQRSCRDRPKESYLHTHSGMHSHNVRPMCIVVGQSGGGPGYSEIFFGHKTSCYEGWFVGENLCALRALNLITIKNSKRPNLNRTYYDTYNEIGMHAQPRLLAIVGKDTFHIPE